MRLPASPRTAPLKPGLSLVELIVVVAIIGLLVGLLLPAVQSVRARASQVRCVNNLRQVGLSLGMYAAAHGRFPPAVTPDRGADYRYMGWGARVLPFVEQQALWAQTLDSYGSAPDPLRRPGHPGLRAVVSLYICPADTRVSTPQPSNGFVAAFTSYLGVSGPDLRAETGVLYRNSVVTPVDIRDGMSNTLLAGERPPSADFFYGWWYAGVGQANTGSCDMTLGVREVNVRGPSFHGCDRGPYRFANGSIKNQCDQFHFWSLHSGGANFAFCDGSVRFLTYAAESVLPALATRAGGEVFEIP